MEEEQPHRLVVKPFRRAPGVPSREEMYQILKARSRELQEAADVSMRSESGPENKIPKKGQP